MKQFGNLLFITVLIVGAGWFTASGYDLLTQELSRYSDQTYGVLGKQLESEETCQKQGTCSALQPVGQDLQEINDTFQQVLGTNDND